MESSGEVPFAANDTLFGNQTVDYFHEDSKVLVITVIFGTLLAIVILCTVIGNVFVIAAILLERNLKNVGNYLVFSLAVADLMVACLVMPLGAVYVVSGQWNLGAGLCDVWTIADVLCCTASILHLLAIAVVCLTNQLFLQMFSINVWPL